MQIDFHPELSAYSIIERIDELPAGIDPDFDNTREELEYDFASFCLTLETN